MSVTSSSDSFASAWRDIRARRLLYWASWLLIVPAVLVGRVFQQQWHSSMPSLVLFLAVIVIHLSAWQRLVSFRCPRCGQPFLWLYSAGRSLPPLGMPVFMQPQCANCGLPKFTSGSPNEI